MSNFSPAAIRICSLTRSGFEFDPQYGTRESGYIDWVIYGGESDQEEPARLCNVQWIEDGLAQCAAAGTAAYVKQLGSNIEVPYSMMPANYFPTASYYFHDGPLSGTTSARMKLRDKKGGDWDEWNERLKVRQMPKVEVHA